MRAIGLYFGWAWIIIVGGLMITPGGIECIRCGVNGTRLLGVISILIGIAGLVAQRRQPAAAAVAGEPETTDDTARAAAPDAVFGMADVRKGREETQVALDAAPASAAGGAGVLPPRGPIPPRKGGTQ